MDDAVEQLKQATLRYAKRQMTWFRGRQYVRWIDADDGRGQVRPLENIVQDAVRLWEEGER
jgi:tRNA dimethylallyltransferase